MEKEVTAAAARWRLTEVSRLSGSRGKSIYQAVSPEFGDVILKWNSDGSELRREAETLSRLDGKGCCRIYGWDEDLRVLLEQRMIPGKTLRKEPDPERRVAAFAQVFRQIHQPAQGGETYLDWLAGICDSCRERDFGEDWQRHAIQAREVCQEMFDEYPERMLLHGDLHHDNLLISEDGTYRMIDPKGVIGPEILDVPRFLLNEQKTIYEGSEREHFDRLFRLVSGELGYPEEQLRRLLFLETVLANVWRLEDGEQPNLRELELAMELQ